MSATQVRAAAAHAGTGGRRLGVALFVIAAAQLMVVLDTAIRPGHAVLTAIYHHALAAGFARSFLIAAGIMLLALVISAATIRLRRADLAGVNPI